MVIRRAEKKDVDRVLELLSQVLETHAQIRPDLFIPGTTKYDRAELEAIFADDSTPVFVAVDEKDEAVGHAFLQIQEIRNNNMHPIRRLYFDDLCVDSAHRGEHIGEALVRFVPEEAKRLGCNETVLNVWEGNDHAIELYKKLGWKIRKTQLELIL